MHTLIVGNQDTARRAFLNRVLEETDTILPRYGFCTKMEGAGIESPAPIYIHQICGERRYTEENLVGYCYQHRATVFADAFETHAFLLENVPDKGIIVMDEIGPMEGDTECFRSAIMRCFDGEAPIIASVRDKDTPFLNAVRNHRNSRCFVMDENDEELFAAVLRFFEEQLKGAAG